MIPITIEYARPLAKRLGGYVLKIGGRVVSEPKTFKFVAALARTVRERQGRHPERFRLAHEAFKRANPDAEAEIEQNGVPVAG